jgi:hypothetical protein
MVAFVHRKKTTPFCEAEVTVQAFSLTGDTESSAERGGKDSNITECYGIFDTPRVESIRLASRAERRSILNARINEVLLRLLVGVMATL